MRLLADGPFVAQRGPFITAAGGSVSVNPGTPTVVGTQITFPSTSSGSLVGGVYGVEFGIGVSAGYVWSENVAGAASSQTITIDIASYGGTSTSTVNARIYYNLDPLDDPLTRVYSAMLAPVVVSASLTGTTTEGQTLTGANGIIVGGYQMTLSQSWSACNTAGTSCTPITAGTATTYVLTASEVGDTIKYTKTATNTAGSGSATSNASAVVVAAGPPGSPDHWYKYATGIAGGATVSQWDDQIGGQHLVQSVAASRPAYSAGVLTFDGSNDALSVAFTQTQPQTIGLRVAVVGWTANDYMFGVGDAGSVVGVFQNTTTPDIACFAGSAVAMNNTNLPANDTWHSVVLVLNGASSKLKVDATTTTTGSPGSGGTRGLTLGAERTALANCSNIRVKEVVMYSSALNDTDIASLVTYLDGI